MAQLNF